ncbi:MAG: hypothetical protein Q7U26_17920 [Aquabacterium sp.]|nr:hypothetical protein [Aquabacterium sp.]
MQILLAFFLLGMVVGTFAAFTATSVVASLLPLFFAFAGGTAIAFAGQVDSVAQKRASTAIAGLSLGCLVGVYSGVWVSAHKLLTPPEARAAATASGSTYLREFSMEPAEFIDQQKRSGAMSVDEAYDKLLELHRHRR